MKNLIAAAAISTLVMGLMPAFAANAAEQVSLCASALDAQGIAAADDYRAKFVKSKGGSTQKVTLKLVPVESGDAVEAQCTIKKGEVLTAEVKA